MQSNTLKLNEFVYDINEYVEACMNKIFSSRNLSWVLKYVIPVLQVIATLIGMAGFMLMYGAVGTQDYYSEIHQAVPESEDRMFFVWVGLGILIMLVSAGVFYLILVFSEWLKGAVAYKKVEEQKAFEENLKWAVGDYLYENHVELEKDNPYYSYTYGSRAIKRRMNIK